MSSTAVPIGLFRLGGSIDPFDFDPGISSLPVIRPRFSLPLLDEYTSGTERLLHCLRYPFIYHHEIAGHDSHIHQEIRQEEKGRVADQDVERVEDDKDLWSEVRRETEVGPSKKAFEVSVDSWSSNAT